MEYAPLSPFGMLVNAGFVGRIVMVVLLAASVWTWVLILDALYVLWRIRRARKAGGREWSDVLWPIEEAGRDAMQLRLPGEAGKQRRARVLREARQAARDFVASAQAGVGNLAIVSSVGPFIGLFGTVWGIMSSFGSIAATQNTGLTVVAPGIAEALAATAYGLAAAIPAAIGYNRLGVAFARLNDEIRTDVDHHFDAAIAADWIDLANPTIPDLRASG